jgi:hypothetical protein
MTEDLGIVIVDKRKKYYEDKKTRIEFDIDDLANTLEFSKEMLEVINNKLEAIK